MVNKCSAHQCSDAIFAITVGIGLCKKHYEATESERQQVIFAIRNFYRAIGPAPTKGESSGETVPAV
jgi:tRNA-binding EMAP/Myf-like protein